MPAYKILKRDGLWRLYCNDIECLASSRIDRVSRTRDRLDEVFSAQADADLDAAIERLIDEEFKK